MALPKPGYIIDLGRLFQNTFGTRPYVGEGDKGRYKLFQNTFSKRPYVVGKEQEQPATANGYRITGSKVNELTTPNGSLIAEMLMGVEIWLPVRFFMPGDTIPICYLPYSVVRVSSKKTIIKTPVMNRQGTVKELYNIEDYSISIKGFVIGDNLQFPEAEIDSLNNLFRLKEVVELDNAMTNVFLTHTGLKRYEQRRVVIESLEFPEVEGGRKNVRPFSMQLESDFVFTLELR